MSRFEIVEIGEETDPFAGIPEGCELCGHCRVLRQTLGRAVPLPCGAAAPPPAATDTASSTTREPNHRP